MFTGIIRDSGIIKSITSSNNNLIFEIESIISKNVKVDESISHDGVCLTVEKVTGNSYQVSAIMETLLKTNLGNKKVGEVFNLERAMKIGDRLDGHFVQGHVDCTAECINISNKNGSFELSFRLFEDHKGLVIEKGSITIDGISLTCYNVTSNSFMVSIIPYTFEHTTMKSIYEKKVVNIEFDILGKYIKSIKDYNF